LLKRLHRSQPSELDALCRECRGRFDRALEIAATSGIFTFDFVVLG
jgi:uncharacterized protein YlaI